MQRVNIAATLFFFAFRMQRVAPLLAAAVLLLFFRIAVFSLDLLDLDDGASAAGPRSVALKATPLPR